MSRLAGFPFNTFPRGWYQIGWSKDLSPGEVRPLKYFGRDLVLYRGESGKVVLMDAFCRHMGAHLGHGGAVRGDDIVCPFHGWTWSSEGENVDIPYSQQKRIGACLNTWHVVEKSGLILMWFNEAGGEPEFDAPIKEEFDDPDYYPIYPHGIAKDVVPFPPQLLIENAVDWPHLIYVHKWDAETPKVLKIEDRGQTFFVQSQGALETSRGIARVTVSIEAWGVGLTYAHLSGMRDMGFVGAMTPIDESTSELRLTSAVKRKEGDAGDEPDGLAKAMIAGQNSEVLGQHPGSDRQIWEHMQYQTHPAVVREELAGWKALRDWTNKFYSDSDKPPSLRAVDVSDA